MSGAAPCSVLCSPGLHGGHGAPCSAARRSLAHLSASLWLPTVAGVGLQVLGEGNEAANR